MNHLAFTKRTFLAAVAALAVVGSVVGASAASAEETATLKMTFKLKGDAPASMPINPNVDQQFCGQFKIPDETLVVNPENKGIKNVIVYVYTGRRGTKLPDMDLKPETHVLANMNCRFQPHVVIAKKGDTIEVTNPDKVGHNANFNFFNNPQQNVTVPPGGKVDIELKDSEPAPIPVACNIHNWMKAQLLVLDNPFGAVTDENGVLEIKGLPVGQEIVFRANHENGSMTKVIVNGEEESWRASKFEKELKAGMNDMGVIEIPVDNFN